MVFISWLRYGRLKGKSLHINSFCIVYTLTSMWRDNHICTLPPLFVVFEKRIPTSRILVTFIRRGRLDHKWNVPMYPVNCTLVPEVFRYFSQTKLSREASTTSCEAAREKNLWYQTPWISLSCRPQGQEGSRQNWPAIEHEITTYLIEKLPHILWLTSETFARKHEPWIGQYLFRKNKRILPTFRVISMAICVSFSVEIP